MPGSHANRISPRALATLAFLGVALSLGGCASVPFGETQLNWPVGATYTVRNGDTVYGIASDFHLSEAALAGYNNLDDPNRIYAGQVLRVPPDSYVPQHQPVRVAPLAPIAPRPAVTVKQFDYRATPEPLPVSVETQEAYSAPLHFIWPVSGRIISPFGATPGGGRNDGINIAARTGQPIRAAAGGSVIYAGDELKGYGNLVLIRHEDGYVTAYAHAERIGVKRGEHVRKGQIIAYAGSTGDVSRPQVHFEIRRGVQPVDPKPLLMASNGV